MSFLLDSTCRCVFGSLAHFSQIYYKSYFIRRRIGHTDLQRNSITAAADFIEVVLVVIAT